ncbi:MAG: SpoIIE family protein phosphatase [Spirochaetes bacterium]|nr:SpoIIE family protein phosphatase [Spirochaetota bacterium]
MNLYLILPLLSFLINFFTMSYAIALNIRNQVNRSYVIFAATISLWVLCSSAFHLPVDDSAIVPFSKFSSIFWYTTGFFFTNFTYVFLRRRRDFFYYATLAVSIGAIIVAMTTDLIVSGHAHYPWGWRFSEGILFTPATLVVLLIPIVVSWVLTLRYRQSTGDPVRRKQLTPILAGVLCAIFVAALNQFLIPNLPGFENSVRYTASWSVILSLFMFYTIIRYRFLTPGLNDIASELFASSKEGVIILNSTGTVLNINTAAVKILNTGATAPSSLRLETLISDYRTDAAYSNYQTTTAGPMNKRAIMISQSEIRAGTITTGRILIINDISEMARMNEALRESHELFKLITNNVTDVIWIFDLGTMRFSYTSPSVTANTGWSPDEFARLQFSDIMNEEDVQLVMTVLGDEIRNDGAREPGRSKILTLKERTRSGAIVDIEIQASFIRDASGKPVAMLGVTRDITEHKRLERELRTSLRQLKERNETIEKDLKTTQIIQRALLPAEPPHCDRLNIDFRYLPLEAVGGDFFNIIQLAEGGLSVFLSDVTGHGITAALFLSLLKSISSTHLRRHAYEPSAYLAAVNADMYEQMHSYFMSAVYGIFKNNGTDQSITLAASCGGHPPPIVHRAGRDAADYLDIRGAMIGVLSDRTFPSLEISLDPGDRVYFYTDGLPEMTNEKREYLGYDRFLHIAGSTRGMGLGEALDAIIAAAHSYRGTGRIDDDIVIIGVEVL